KKFDGIKHLKMNRMPIFISKKRVFAETHVVFHAKRDRATNANAHLAHLQAPTHKLMLQLAKEPNFCRRTQD
ncbi:MAG: hypothetical protein JXA77_16505, partial [Bacteroidales bacterium]|nr:hypothetical protein [Bacteroidales bacterium]